jgi:hypothetical protein
MLFWSTLSFGTVITERVTETSMGDADTPKNSSVGKTPSLVWNHFTVTARVDGKPAKSQCNHCSNIKEYNCNAVTNGTTAMLKHMQKKHTQIWNGGAGSTEPTAHPPNPSRYLREFILIPCISASGIVYVHHHRPESPLRF